MRLQDVMTAQVVTVDAGEPVSVARSLMRQYRIRHLPVVDDGRLAGIVSERDLGGARGESARGLTVRDVMTADAVSAPPTTTLRKAANLMRGRTIGSLLVVDDGRVVGIVTTTDLLDQVGRGAFRPAVGTEEPPTLRSPPGRRRARGKKAPRLPAAARPGRVRRPATQRAALPTAIPRAEKLRRGRTPEIPPPAHIRVIGAALDQDDRDEIARKLGRRLGKFASSIQRVSVRLSDVNGPKGGADHRFVIKVVLAGLPTVVVDERDSVLQRAVNQAIDAAAIAVQRSVQRRRLKPIQRGKPRSLRTTS